MLLLRLLHLKYDLKVSSKLLFNRKKLTQGNSIAHHLNKIRNKCFQNLICKKIIVEKGPSRDETERFLHHVQSKPTTCNKNALWLSTLEQE